MLPARCLSFQRRRHSLFTIQLLSVDCRQWPQHSIRYFLSFSFPIPFPQAAEPAQVSEYLHHVGVSYGRELLRADHSVKLSIQTEHRTLTSECQRFFLCACACAFAALVSLVVIGGVAKKVVPTLRRMGCAETMPVPFLEPKNMGYGVAQCVPCFSAQGLIWRASH
ncbi:hypothetical protein CPB84DRAFT_1556448 [Gymnopilus junonius]|uniref:Transmembrane protein n=1 Tax=Gymnopilus junonius TaxID=109634 RepID=A0A9P5NIU6_GYMJU|nr:hypothetical protein CPB84DRAFT_1556448 [Gymnopilus junonius]